VAVSGFLRKYCCSRCTRAKRHEANYPLSHHHLRRPNTDMLSKLKKKLKPRLPGSKHTPIKTGTDAGGKRVDPTGSLPRPEPHAVAGPSYVEVAMGSGSRREGNDIDGEEAGRVYPSLSTPSLVHGGEPDGMWARLFLAAVSNGSLSQRRYLYRP
jgi:hypothetical protein